MILVSSFPIKGDELKLVVVNSSGPMGSTVIGAIVEKFGYLNVPVRKLGLHDYMFGIRQLNDGFFKSRISEYLESHSKVITTGGVNVADRDSAPPRKLLEIENKDLLLKELEGREFKSISDMYCFGRNLYAKNIIYKSNQSVFDKHIEYTVDIGKYDPIDLERLYKQNFDEVFFINIQRDFSGWLDSLASQKISHPSFKVRCMFSLRGAWSQYNSYRKAVRSLDGLDVDFDEMFLPNTNKLINAIAEFIKEPKPEIAWENEQYDLFGKLSNYNKCFTVADSSLRHLSSITHKVARRLVSKERIGFFGNLTFACFYLFDLLRHKLFSR